MKAFEIRHHQKHGAEEPLCDAAPMHVFCQRKQRHGGPFHLARYAARP